MNQSKMNINNRQSAEAYTEKDTDQFDNLMKFQESRSKSDDVQSDVHIGMENFQFSETDSMQFEILKASLDGNQKYQKQKSRQAEITKSDEGYTDKDISLFKSLGPKTSPSTSNDHDSSKSQNETIDVTDRYQSYSNSDLEQFQKITPRGSTRKEDTTADSFLNRSPNDRDVGFIKIRRFDQSRKSDIDVSKSENPNIKVRYFD